MAPLSKRAIDDARAAAEEAQPEAVRENLRAGRPIVEQLVAVGLEIEELGDLPLAYVAQRARYKSAVPVLIAWLDRVKNPDVRLGLVMALAVPEARRAAWAPLAKAFHEVDCSDRFGFHLKSQIARALSVVAVEENLGEAARLVKDKRHGQCRRNLVATFGRLKGPDSVPILIEVLGDADRYVAAEALRPLARLKVREASGWIRERFLNDPDPWIRKEAMRALERIAKANKHEEQ